MAVHAMFGWAWRKSAVLAACFWTVVALVFVVPRLGHGADWRETVLSSFAQWWAWGLLAPVITAIDERLPAAGQRIGLRIVANVILGILVALAYPFVWSALEATLGLSRWSEVFESRRFIIAWNEMFWSLLVYGLIVGVWRAHRYRNQYLYAELRAQRLERNFAEAQLNGLRMQLDPHFLFNALNTISAHAEREPRLARQMIEHLGDLLRLSLSSQSRPIVTLADELAFLDHYLAIQKIRFGDRLCVQTEVSMEVSQALVPSLFLQPLVENAIRHGLEPRAARGTVVIRAERANDSLQVKVLDDGVGLPSVWPPAKTAGVGLSVTRERIAGLYPQGTSHFSVHRRATGGTAVEISFPLHFGEANDDGSVA